MKKNFIKFALDEAIKAEARMSVPVGAVVVMNDKIIAKAGNEVIKNNDPTAHAEILAIRRACEFLDTTYLTKCDLYVTLEPCAMCAQAISLARIRRLYFGAYDAKYGAVEHNAKVFDYALHKPEIVGGVMETECSDLLKKFFAKLKKVD